MRDPCARARLSPARSCWLLACALAAAGAAHAGRPLQTEDAGVIDAGGCEIEGVHERLRVSGETARDTSLAFNCGVGWRSQLGLAGSRSSAEGTTTRGIALGGKTRLWSAGDDGPALALGWSLGWARQDGSWRHAEDQARLAWSMPAGPGTLHLNLGHARDRLERTSAALWAVAWEHGGVAAGGITLAPMAEVYGDDRGGHAWNVALRATLVPDRLYIDGSYGRQNGSTHARLVTVGFKVTF